MEGSNMKVKNYRDVEAAAEAPGATMRWVIDDKDGAPNFALRVVELEPGATSPFHKHDWEHEVFVLSGTGAVRDKDEGLTSIGEGDAVLLLPDEKHQFMNQGKDTLRFVCVIPNLE
jgi:quercetin dioxygenase-like cupin family protein